MVKSLIKIRFLSALSRLSGATGSNKKKSGTAASIALTALLYTFLFVFFGAVFTLLALQVAPVLIAAGADWFYFLMFIGIDMTLVFIFGIFSAKTEIFECKDNELLLSMPINPFSIVLSRVFTVIIFNYIESAFVFIPSLIVYAVCGGAIRGVIGGLTVFAFIPLLPTSLSCIVGFAVSALTAKIKKKNLFTVIFFLVFFFAYMYGYGILVEGASSVLADIDSAAASVGHLAILYDIGNAAMLDPFSLPFICLLSVVSAVVTVAVISAGFERVTSSSDPVEKKGEYKFAHMSRRTLKISLIKNELSRFFSSATYMINSSLGVIFSLLFSVFAILKRDELVPLVGIFADLFEVDAGELTSIVAVAALSICVSFSYMASCSLSLEGKSFWILKSMPIPAVDVLFAKALTQLIITALPTLISSVLLLFAFGGRELIWYYILIPQLVGVVSAVLGILLNTAFPKFDFVNEASVIKNSASVFLTLVTIALVGAALGIMGGWLLIRIPFVAVALLQLGALLLVIAAMIFILVRFATAKYESL